MKTLTIISFISIVANIVFAVPCFASSVTNDGITIMGDNVSGTIYTDINANGIQDANEPAVAHAIVNIHLTGSDMIESLIADEFGNFDTGIMTSGLYSVWCEDDKNALSVNNLMPSATDSLTLSPAADLSNDIESIELRSSVANLANDTDAIEVSSVADLTDDMDMIEIQTVLLPFIIG